MPQKAEIIRKQNVLLGKPSEPTVIDLFAGVGGLSLGAARAGFKVALAVELDKHAITAHKKNFPLVNQLSTNINDLDGEKLLFHAGLKIGELDGLVGGPPCQGFSVIGHRCVTDPRNNLFQKFFELVSECQPRFFVAENVLGILDEQYSDIRDEALALVGANYVVLAPMQFKASDFGAPTSRERAFFIGYRSDCVQDMTESDFMAVKTKNTITVEKALKGLPARIRSTWLTEEQGLRKVCSMPATKFSDRVINGIPVGIGDAESIRLFKDEKIVSGCMGTRHSPKVQARYQKLKPGQKDDISKAVRLKLDGLCPTLRAGTAADKGSYQAVRPIHPTAPRVITPREAARLQGFPDWFQFAPTKWHSFRQIGNSVSPFVAEAVLGVIYSKLAVIRPRK